jgi:hypothetical protein
MTVQHIRSSQFPTYLNGIVLTNSMGVPRYWPTVWEAMHGSSVRASTLIEDFQ